MSDAQLKSYFEEQKAKNPEGYTQAEHRRVRHILFQVTDPKDDAAAKAKAETALKRVASRRGFRQTRARNCRRTRARRNRAGISVGRSARSGWRRSPTPRSACRRARSAARSRRNSATTSSSSTASSRRPVKTFEQSQGDLEAEYRRNEAERLFNSLQDKLADAALQNATDIEVVARKAGLPVQYIAGFSRADRRGRRSAMRRRSSRRPSARTCSTGACRRSSRWRRAAAWC